MLIELVVWQQELLDYLKVHGQIGTKEAAQVWKISSRAARDRLKQMVNQQLIRRISTSVQDPHAIFVVAS